MTIPLWAVCLYFVLKWFLKVLWVGLLAKAKDAAREKGCTCYWYKGGRVDGPNDCPVHNPTIGKGMTHTSAAEKGH